MAEVEYKRGIEKNYLIISGKEMQENYQVKMLVNNRVEGILPLEIRYVDARIKYYYEINSKQPLNKVFEQKEITFEQAKTILYQIDNIIQRTKEYLVEENYLYFSPEFVYINQETLEVELVFFPEKMQSSHTDFTELADFFLQHINHNEQEAVYFAYQFYKISLQENFVMQDILGLFQMKETKKDNQQEYVGLEEIEEVEEDEVKENKKGIIGIAIGSVLAVVGIGGMISFPQYYELALVSIGIAVMSFGYTIICAIQEKKYEKLKKQNIQDIETNEIYEEYNGNTILLGYENTKKEHRLKGVINGKKEEYVLNRYPVSIGKNREDNEICIDESCISRRHAEIFEKNEQVYLKDLKSTNGTYKNGIRLAPKEEVLLETGDEIEFANICLTYY